MCVTTSPNALTLALFAKVLLPSLPLNTTGAVTILVATALNYFGAKPAARQA